MPFVETRLISPTTLTTSASSVLYTVPTGYSAIIKQLVVTNITGTAATFTFYIGAASASNALFSGTSVAANDTVIINLSQVLSTGEVLRALASTGSALNLTVSGVINDGPLASTATYIADNAITVNKIADGSVTNSKIADGAIMNIDINASAAIDQSKVNAPTAATGTNTTQIATTAFANAAGGLVLISVTSPTPATTVAITGCFSSLYTDYKVIITPISSASSSDIRIKLRSGATPASISYYMANTFAGGSSIAAVAENNATSWRGVYCGTGGVATYNFLTFDVFGPFSSGATRYQMNSSAWDGTQINNRSATGFHDQAISYDSFELSGSANITATIAVYGYKK